MSGKISLLKAHPRFVRATALLVALGHDQPLILYEGHLGSNRAVSQSALPKGQAGWIWLEAYLFSVWANRGGISLLREVPCLAGRLPRVQAFPYLTWREPLAALVLFARTMKRVVRPGNTPDARHASSDHGTSGTWFRSLSNPRFSESACAN